jgi:2-polyprenyl-6-methoxyphenol hydroxylase-like FAD-dependent oxidoreductase
MDQTDVLIVGAGPTGLTLACELAARGVPHRLVDQAPVASDKSRALVVHARTLEVFQKMGFADRLVERGRTAFDFSVWVAGREAVALQIGDTGVDDTPFPFLLFVSQAETEKLLTARLAELGGRVERPAQVIGFDEDPGGVVARFADGRALRARFVAGCDGAHSVVRKAAGCTFEGAAYESDFVLGDVAIDWSRSNDAFHLILPAEGGVLALLPLTGDRRWRVIVTRVDAPEHEGDPTLAELQALVDRFAPEPLKLRDPVWLQRFRLHHRGVDRYRAGRFFVAGDAAHIHSPAGGQGMNTGIQDAFNLGWKLALAAQGHAGDFLLDSYHGERWPVGQRLLSFTDRLFALNTSGNPLAVRLRNFFVPRVAPRALASRRLRASIFRFVSQLGIAYRDSAIVEDHPLHGGPHAGDRAPESDDLFSRLTGTRFHLLAIGWEPTLPSRLAPLVEVHRFTAPPPRYGTTSPATWLIRPDGYVSYRAHGPDASDVVEHLDRLLQR